MVKEFERGLREKVIEARIPELLTTAKMLSSTQPFATSKKVVESKRKVFNFVSCDNEFELTFARFLDKSYDLEAFAKLPELFGFCIQYTDTLANIRNYFPYFIARLSDGSHWLIETKGREDIEVAMKDNAAQNWCDTATALNGVQWNYIKVLQKDFEKLRPESFEELIVGLKTMLD